MSVRSVSHQIFQLCTLHQNEIDQKLHSQCHIMMTSFSTVEFIILDNKYISSFADDSKKRSKKRRGSSEGHRTPPKHPKDASRRASHRRAVKNWHRAKAAAQRKVTKDMLGPQRRQALLSQKSYV